MAPNAMSFRKFVDEMKAVAEGRKKAPVRADKQVYANEAARVFAQKLGAAEKRARKAAPDINITTLAGVTRLMSRDNQELLRLISEAEVSSVAELAVKAKRAESNLSRTLKKLEGIGVLELVPGEGRAKVPRIAVKSFKVDIDVISGAVTVVSAEKAEQATGKASKPGKLERVKGRNVSPAPAAAWVGKRSAGKVPDSKAR